MPRPSILALYAIEYAVYSVCTRTRVHRQWWCPWCLQGAKSGKERGTVVVGVVGFPNTGKSSIINSLKRARVCTVGSTPGVTKCAALSSIPLLSLLSEFLETTWDEISVRDRSITCLPRFIKMSLQVMLLLAYPQGSAAGSARPPRQARRLARHCGRPELRPCGRHASQLPPRARYLIHLNPD